MCQYQGYEFGASYPDSVCIDGRLFDADACDDNGLMFEPMDDIPCPMCHPWHYVQWLTARFEHYDFKTWIKARYFAIRVTLDIIKNRLMKTEPWRVKR